MKNLKKISRKDLKEVKGGSPGVINLGGGGGPRNNPMCYQYMEEWTFDCNSDPNNDICRVCFNQG
jgi:hypothetical protein